MALPEAGVSLVADGLSSYLSGMNQADSVSKGFFSTLDSGAKQTSSFSEIATGALRRVGEVAVNAFGQALQASVGFFKDSVSLAGDFQSGLQEVGAVAGDSLAEYGYTLDDVSKKALKLGADTVYSSSEALSAMNNLLKGGVDVKDVMSGATDAVLNLATAGGVNLDTASEIVAKTLAVWAKNGIDAATATDLITQAANASTVGVEDLAAGLNNAQGRAKALGVEYDDFVSTIALIAPAFSSTEQAGTSYNNFLARLSFSTKEQKKVAKELGLITEDGANVFFDATGAFVGNREAAVLLQKAYQGLSAEDKNYIGGVLFGNDAMGAANALIESGAEGYDKQVEAMKKAGTAQQQAEARSKSFNFAMKALSGSVETLQISIGTFLLPILTTLLNDYLIPVVNSVTEFAQGFLSTEGPLVAFGNYIQAVLMDGDLLNDWLSHLPMGFQGIAKSIGGFLVSGQAFINYIQAVLEDGDTLNDWLSHLPSPLQDIAKAIGDTVATGQSLLNYFSAVLEDGDTLNDWLTHIPEPLQGMSKAIADVSVSFVPFAKYLGAVLEDGDTLNDWLTNISPAFRGMAQGVGEAAATLKSGLITELDKVKLYVDTKWTQLEPAVTASLTNIKTWVASQWPAVETNLKSALDNVVKWVQSNWPNLESQVTSVIDNIVNHATVELPKISQGFGPLMESIKKLAASFSGVMQAIGSRVAPVIDKLGEAFVKSAPYIQQISTELNKLAVTVLPGLAAIVAVVVGAILGLVNAIIYGVATALPFLTMAVAGVVTAITEFITGFINLVVGLGTAIYDAATGNFASAWQVIQDTVGNTVLAIISTLGGLAQAALGIVAGLVSAIVGFFYGLYITLVGGSIIPDMIMAIIQWFAMLPGQLLSLVTQMVTGLIGYISANLGTWMATLLAWGTAAWNWLAVAIPQVITQLGVWGTTLLNYLSANLPTWVANLLLWSNQLWEFVKNAIPPLIAQLIAFLNGVLSWATGEFLPMLIEQATAWAISLYEWVTKELIPGIQPKLTEFATMMIARLVQMGKDFAKKAVEIGESIIDGLIDAIENGASSVVNAIINTVTAAIKAAKEAIGFGSPAKEFIKIGESAMQGFAVGIKENEKEPSVEAIRAARKTIDAVLGALKGVEGHGISNEITEVLESWSKTVGSLSDLFDNLEKLAGFKKFNSESFRKAVVEGTAGVLNGLREAANYISTQFKAYNAKQLDAMEVRGTVQELLDNWINSVGSIAGMIDNLKSIFSFGKRKNLATFLDSVRTGTGALIDALRAAAQIVVEKFGAANLGMPTISDEIQTMLDNWTGLISTITDALANIKKLWSFGKSNTQGLKESVYDAVIKIMEAMNAVQQAVADSKPAQTASNIMQSALNQSLASSDIQVKVPQISMTMGQNTGVAIIDGMEGAIRKSGVRVANALVDVVTTAIDAAKKALGIASPSKVFFEVGMNTTKGLGLGIERGGYQVVDVMTETLGRMINAIPNIGRGGTIAPPMSGQQIAQNSTINNSTSRSFTYAPTYNTAPPQTVDMAIANAMAGSFA